MLKYKLGAEEFDKLSEAEKTFYAQAGDGYQLQVEGATDKAKVDDFRTKNIELMNNAKQFEGVDMDKYNAVMEKERALRNKELIDKGEFDTLLAEHTNSMRSDFEAKIATLTEQNESITNTHNSAITKYEIEGAATKAFGAHKINPEAFDSVMAQIKNKFSIDGGQVVAREGDTILAGADGNLTVDEFVASQPEIFKLQSNGGGGQGSSGHNAPQQHVNTRAKIASGLEKMLG